MAELIQPAGFSAALLAVAPRTKVAVWTAALTEPMQAAGLTTPRRVAMFLGQCAEESGGFTRLVENLSYSARRACEVWPARFPSLADAAPYAKRPIALANKVYANRLGNGDAASGDGWTFRGCGLIQLTGRANHSRFAAAVGRTPEEAAAWMQTPPGAAASACWYWGDRGGLLEMSDAWDVEGVTRRINGGLTNLAERERLCEAALLALEPG